MCRIDPYISRSFNPERRTVLHALHCMAARCNECEGRRCWVDANRVPPPCSRRTLAAQRWDGNGYQLPSMRGPNGPADPMMSNNRVPMDQIKLLPCSSISIKTGVALSKTGHGSPCCHFFCCCCCSQFPVFIPSPPPRTRSPVSSQRRIPPDACRLPRVHSFRWLLYDENGLNDGKD